MCIVKALIYAGEYLETHVIILKISVDLLYKYYFPTVNRINHLFMKS